MTRYISSREVEELYELLKQIWDDYGRNGDISVDALERLEKVTKEYEELHPTK